jgi:hypothetical protein
MNKLIFLKNWKENCFFVDKKDYNAIRTYYKEVKLCNWYKNSGICLWKNRQLYYEKILALGN